MHAFQQQTLDAWRIHESKTWALLEHVSQAGLEATLSTRGGRSVGQQLVHAHNVRLDQLVHMRKELVADVAKLERDQGHDRQAVRVALEMSGNAVAALIEGAEDGQVKRFKGGLVTFVAYLIAHESHHRGGIVLTLKQTMNALSKDAYWQLWGWSKGAPA
jgi:uncharacterized damage-inducible protein DinB